MLVASAAVAHSPKLAQIGLNWSLGTRACHLSSQQAPQMQEDSKKFRVQWIGFFLGPILAIACLFWLPDSYQLKDSLTVPGETSSVEQQVVSGSGTTQSFSWAGRATLAVMIWMGVWWLTEAIDISATALLPLVLFPLLGASDIKAAAFPYADHLIFLYFGGFILAMSMERWGLGKRIALMTLRLIGTTAPRMIAGFMSVTAVLSAFVSNTATTAMMLPIAISTIGLLRSQQTPQSSASEKARIDSFSTCLLLSIAYSASVGGIMTIIGTPTNAFLIGFLRDGIAEPYRSDFSFAGWLPIGVSLAAIFLPIIYIVMTRFLFPIQGVELSGGKAMIDGQLRELGSVHRGEWNTLLVFLATVTLWLVRPLITPLELTLGGRTFQPLAGLTDTGIAMVAAILLFLLPVRLRERQFTMDWTTANQMPWGILILFGGGLSLAAAVKANGVAEFIGSYAGVFGSLPTLVTVLMVTTAIVFLTELTSNVATTTSLVPVLAALAPAVGVHPYLLIIPATVAASCAFMLPVATPPNAIVFGSGEIALPQMVRTGFVLNLLAILVVTALAFLVVQPFLGI